MSNQTNADMLREVFVELNEILTHYEEPPQKLRDEITYRKNVRTHFLGLYVRYVGILNKLDSVYDSLLQPQKREDLLDVFEAVLNRFLNLSYDMRKIYGEYLDQDKVLIDLKRIMDDAVLRLPRYFREDEEEEIRKRDVKMNILLERHNIADQSRAPIFELEDHGPSLSVQEAVLIIQRCFRSFQARKKTEKVQLLRRQEMSYRASIENKSEQTLDFRRAAITVQRVWRGYITRKKVEEKAQSEMIFLGMKQGPDAELRARKQRLEEIRKKRKAIQKQNRRELEEARIMMRNKILKEEGPQIARDMRDQIMEKFILLKQISGGKPIYFPTEKEGGSKTFMSENSELIREAVEIEKKKKKEERDAQKRQSRSYFGSSGKRKFGKDDLKKPGENRKKILLDEPTSRNAISQSVTKFLMKWGNSSHSVSSLVIPPNSTKNLNSLQFILPSSSSESSSFVKSIDFNEPFYSEILRKELMEGDLDLRGNQIENGRVGIEEELRIQNVDPLIREELEKMNYKGKRKKKKPRRRKKKKSPLQQIADQQENNDKNNNNNNPENKPKNVKNKSLTKENEKENSLEKSQEIDILLSQLVKNQIAQKYIPFKISDYLYTHSNIGSLRSQHTIWYESSLSQIRSQLVEIIIGLGSRRLHLTSPPTKSVLFYGPSDTGKTMLSKILANELGAMWFDLSNLVQHYDVRMISDAVDMVFEVALHHPPAILYYSNIENLFTTKIKKSMTEEEKKTNRKRVVMRKALKRFITRKIKPGSRVLFIGNSSKPWEGGNLINELFDRFVMTVIPDFAGRKLIFEKLIYKKLGERYGSRASLLDRFEFQILAQITEGYPAGAIARIVEKVMTKRRIKRLPLREMTIDEFIGPLSKYSPIFNSENEKFEKYVKSLPIENRKKTKEDEEQEEEKIKEEIQKMKEERKKNKRRGFGR